MCGRKITSNQPNLRSHFVSRLIACGCRDAGLHFHFDKDECAASDDRGGGSTLLHPAVGPTHVALRVIPGVILRALLCLCLQLSSVFYLSTVGGATVVLPQSVAADEEARRGVGMVTVSIFCISFSNSP